MPSPKTRYQVPGGIQSVGRGSPRNRAESECPMFGLHVPLGLRSISVTRDAEGSRAGSRPLVFGASRGRRGGSGGGRSAGRDRRRRGCHKQGHRVHPWCPTRRPGRQCTCAGRGGGTPPRDFSRRGRAGPGPRVEAPALGTSPANGLRSLTPPWREGLERPLPRHPVFRKRLSALRRFWERPGDPFGGTLPQDGLKQARGLGCSNE